jgi:long-subunit acyl-CoA synthetase (AMP-forming)
MSGYYKEHEATKKAFTSEGWLRTGDVVELDDRDRVKIVGRISENFKNQSGEFVAPTPIERQFEVSDMIERLCLIGRGLP